MRTLVYFICFYASLVSSQGKDNSDVKSGLSNISKAYQTDHILSFKVKIRYYDQNDLKTIKDSLQATVTTWKKRVRYVMPEKVFLYNDHYSLIVNHKRKTILIAPPSSKLMNNMHPDFLMDSLSSQYGIEASEIRDGKINKELRFSYQKGPVDHPGLINYFDMSYNKSTFLVDEFSIHYKKDVRLREDLAKEAVIIFSYFDYKYLDDKSQSFFSESEFVIIKDDKVFPSQAFKNYKIINHLNRIIHENGF